MRAHAEREACESARDQGAIRGSGDVSFIRRRAFAEEMAWPAGGRGNEVDCE